MIHFVMVVTIGFILAMGVIFIAIELCSRFDRSFLIFGIANILLLLFCLIDIEMQPVLMIQDWIKLQHVIAAFFPAVLLWHLMTIVNKVHARTIIVLTIIGVLFALSMISESMFSIQDDKLIGTVFYNSLFVSFTIVSIVGCTAFLCFHYLKSKGKTRMILRWNLVGFGILGVTGILEIAYVITGNRFLGSFPSLVVFGLICYSLISTIILINRLSVIIINREQIFSKLREAYKELDHLRPLARVGQLTALFAHEVKNKSFGISLMVGAAKRTSLPPTVLETLDKFSSIAAGFSRSSHELLAHAQASWAPAEQFDLAACISETAEEISARQLGDIVFDL